VIAVSQNYDVLRQAGKDAEILKSPIAAQYEGKGSPGRINGCGKAREEILKLIQRTFLAGTLPSPRFVVFSAVEHGSGCSWLCAHAAKALAEQVDGTVCLVDANLRSPSLHRYFGSVSGPGLADAMSRPDPVRSFTQAVQGTNLFLMSGGSAPLNSLGAMSADRLKCRFVELCSEFNFVLVDAPPVHDSADMIMLGRIADGAVLVLEANSTRREAARRAKASLVDAGVRILGAVLNRRTFPIPKGLYSKF
jgi:protein-tyrosine kinase